MDIRISGHQVDTGAAFGEHVHERLGAMVAKYFPRALSAHVTLGPAPYGHFACDIVMHVMADLILKGSARAADAHVAFDGAADRIDKQLRRYMRRLKDRHSPAAGRSAPEVAELPPLDNAEYKIFAAAPDDVEPAGDAPLIIAETRVDIPTASVGDAVMMLDLRNTTALLFVNSATGDHNMVYRREDGTIGWVEPRAQVAGAPRRAVMAG
ncbi:ribosomal subunit interface protein [Sandarakinorhabdus cyanobacteriorum]|uniref:Ribosome hibernation promoting factor n=1 Tax=Sandarakinorhabdus cyanobacteriorum TaxID=1981098 RepID=A0A255YC52_9SPHN|nr:ribosome-associated translation inhibitor RaiA [Sandarakinorhabdus cyanobacteriorum]OYQ26743.1 ribosomal subunit interface protein [Sandarakinorhabdus cyanobacteriorum]